MFYSPYLLVLFWACCIANIIPSSVWSPQTPDINPRPFSAFSASSGDSTTTTFDTPPSVFDTATHSSLDIVPLDTRNTASTQALQTTNTYWYAQCNNGKLAKCTTEGVLWCTSTGELQTSLQDCASLCTCVEVAPLDECFNAGTRYDCWGSLQLGASRKELATTATSPREDDASSIATSGAPLGCADSPFATVCWQNKTQEQNTTSLKMCPFMAFPVNYDSHDPSADQAIVADTPNCMGLLDLYLSPELPATYLTAQQLYANDSVEIAHYGDCHLFVSGGENATAEFMDHDDIFYIGNFDLADAILTLVMTFAYAGNVTTFAACGTLNECPVLSLVNSADKTGQIGFRFCVGGGDLDLAAWGV